MRRIKCDGTSKPAASCSTLAFINVANAKIHAIFEEGRENLKDFFELWICFFDIFLKNIFSW